MSSGLHFCLQWERKEKSVNNLYLDLCGRYRITIALLKSIKFTLKKLSFVFPTCFFRQPSCIDRFDNFSKSWKYQASYSSQVRFSVLFTLPTAMWLQLDFTGICALKSFLSVSFFFKAEITKGTHCGDSVPSRDLLMHWFWNHESVVETFLAS